MKAALVVLSSGIGNIIRWTPLISALAQLGYTVDVWLDNPDYPDSDLLLRGSPHIRRVFFAKPMATPYDVVCVSHWSSVDDSDLPAYRVLRYPRDQWRAHGDYRAGEELAIACGWRRGDPMPSPFVMQSARTFDLHGWDDVLVMHPGCKAGWPWKRWPYFDALAWHFPHVVIVGTEEDRGLTPPLWPAYVIDMTGQLSLPDTAALMRQCAAFVGNDSGLSHMAAAVGIPTFTIFGITRAWREALPGVHAIDKRSLCDVRCGVLAHNARTCPRNVACLHAIDPRDVAAEIKNTLTLVAT